MFKGCQKIFLLLICLILVLPLLSMNTISGKGIIIEYDQPEVGVVIDVIDGEAIKVMYIYSKAAKPSVELIRLIGVNSMANDDTYEYMKDQLLGKPVFILYDDNDLPVIDGYRNAYVYTNTEQSINETLLTYGYGVLDETYSNATYYQDLVDAEYYAIRQEKGIYKISTTANNIININLASSTLMQEHFGISAIQAAAIVNYRLKNPINSSVELGFVHEDFDREFIIDNRSSIHYTTNINDATLYELASLFSSFNSLSIANDIHRDRVFSPFTSVEELKSISSLSYYYNNIEPFITTTINNNIYIDEDELIANVNTASSAQLVEATGMSTYYADKITEQREKTRYIYKSLEELTKSNFPFTNMDISSFIDNLSVKTDLNTASDYELRTLFASFELSETLEDTMINKINYSKPFSDYTKVSSVIGATYYNIIEPMIVISGVSKPDTESINVNGTSREELADYLDLDDDTRTSVLAHTSDYTNPSEFTFLEDDDIELVSIYTNINTASYNELLNLNSRMTSSIAKAIIDYRSYYPIYSLAELKQLLYDENKLYLYQLIKNDVVFY